MLFLLIKFNMLTENLYHIHLKKEKLPTDWGIFSVYHR
jgi:hypothetical protein